MVLFGGKLCVAVVVLFLRVHFSPKGCTFWGINLCFQAKNEGHRSLADIFLFLVLNESNSSKSIFFWNNFVSAGYFTNFSLGRTGRLSNPPPQFGQTLSKRSFTHSEQKVHSNEQIIASVLSGGRRVPQCSQLGFRSSIEMNCRRFVYFLKVRFCVHHCYE